jgi:hypothetical protein
MRMLTAVLALTSTLALAQAPQRVSYQGLLLKTDGTPETGLVSMTFSIYSAASGGASQWSETQTVLLSQGYYATTLGDTTALTPSLFDGTEHYLELSVAGSALTPRMRLVSVPYAISAASAGGVTGGVVDTTSVRINGTEVINGSGAFVGPGALSGAGGLVVDGGVVSLPRCANGDILRYGASNTWSCSPYVSDAGFASYFADGTGGLLLTGTTFSLLRSCSSGQVLKWNGSAWACAADDNTVSPVSSLDTGSGLVLSGGALSLARSCTTGQVLKWTGTGWGCAADLDTVGPFTSLDVGSGLVVNSGALSLARSCASGQVLKWTGTNWSCAADDNTSVTASAPLSLSGSVLSLTSCGVGQVHQANASGAWVCVTAATGTVTNVTGTSPVSVANGTSAPVVSMTQATGSSNGWLSSTDYTTFSNKVASVSGSGPISVTVGTTPVISISAASSTTSGYLSVADYLAFTGKVTNLVANAPLSATTGTSPTLSIAQASSSTSGYLSYADFNTFSNKLSTINATSPLSISGSTPTVSISTASATTTGALSATDWNTFNNKADASGSANYIQNQLSAAQSGGFNVGTGIVGKLGLLGTTPSYPIDVGDNGTLSAARLGNVPVSIGPGPRISFNNTWNGGFAYNYTQGYSATLAYDQTSGELIYNGATATANAGASTGFGTHIAVSADGRVGFNLDYGTATNAFLPPTGIPFKIGNSAANGNGAYLTAAGVWTNISTRTKKTQIRPANDALSLLEQVHIYRYRYKTPNGGDDGRDHLGVIAEELPDVVASEDHKGAPTAELIGLALGADRELAAKVKVLEAEKAQQAAQIQALLRRLDALEAKQAKSR